MAGVSNLPVKNTFIHFNQPEDADASEESSDSRRVYWLQSGSSGSATSSRQRPASADPSNRSSSCSLSDNGEDLSVLRAKAAQWKQQHTGSKKGSEPEPVVNGEPEAVGQSKAKSPERPQACAPSLPVPLDAQSERLLQRIPRDADGNITSLGSAGHESGKCIPCTFWFKGVCINGPACGHCHFFHEGQKSKRLRPSKEGRERLRKKLEMNDVAEESGGPGLAPNQMAVKLMAAVRLRGLKVAVAGELRAAGQQTGEDPSGCKVVPLRPGPLKVSL